MTGSEYKNERLRELREAKKLTMEQAGELVGKTRMMVHYAEKGIRCSDKLLRKFAAVYGVRYKNLLRDEAPSRKALASGVNKT